MNNFDWNEIITEEKTMIKEKGADLYPAFKNDMEMIDFHYYFTVGEMNRNDALWLERFMNSHFDIQIGPLDIFYFATDKTYSDASPYPAIWFDGKFSEDLIFSKKDFFKLSKYLKKIN
jgi:hypothetical protein